MAQDFDKQVYALSVIRRVQDFPPQKSLRYSKMKVDIKLLNFIALLLVMKGKGEGAAVAMEHLPNALNFYYSKNSPCPPELGEYIQRLITHCASVEVFTFTKLFFDEVINSCRPKVKSRLNKCKRAIRLFQNIKDIEFTGEVAAQQPRSAKYVKDYRGKSFSEVAQAFLERLVNYDMEPHKGGSGKATFELCVDAHFIGQEEGLKQQPALVSRIKKLGDYYGAVRLIRDRLREPALRHLQKSISFTEIKPPRPKVVEISENIIKILNYNAQKYGLDVIEAAEYEERFSQSVQENDKPQQITISSHCELTLALHFYEKMTGKQHFMKMGISKGCCWMCQKFIDAMSQPNREKRVVVAMHHNHGKIHAGWGMPDKTPSDVAEEMKNTVTGSLLEIQQTVIDRRIGYSFSGDNYPDSSSGSDQDAEIDLRGDYLRRGVEIE